MASEKTKYYIEYKFENEVDTNYYDTADEMFVAASKAYAFSDCYPVDIVRIVCDGKEVEYDGWQPGMVYSFSDMDGKQVWCGMFPAWDH